MGYHGEVNISQDDLNRFLALAEELKLKGLITNNFSDNEEPITKIDEFSSRKEIIENIISSDVIKEETNILPETSPQNTNQVNLLGYNSGTISESRTSIDASILELEETIASLIVKTEDGLWACTCCGKTLKAKKDLKRHVESMHVEGMEHPCNICGKTFRSRNAVQCHTRAKCRISS